MVLCLCVSVRACLRAGLFEDASVKYTYLHKEVTGHSKHAHRNRVHSSIQFENQLTYRHRPTPLIRNRVVVSTTLQNHAQGKYTFQLFRRSPIKYA